MANVGCCRSNPTMDGALAHGIYNDHDGCDITIAITMWLCRCKAYDDYKKLIHNIPNYRSKFTLLLIITSHNTILQHDPPTLINSLIEVGKE